MSHVPTTTQSGRQAESRAESYLVAHGYVVRARNYRVKGGEIDLICQAGEVLVFVEVRARSGRHASPEETIDGLKRARIVRAAREYLLSLDEEPACRFDVIAIEGQGEAVELTHLEDAFQADRY